MTSRNDYFVARLERIRNFPAILRFETVVKFVSSARYRLERFDFIRDIFTLTTNRDVTLKITSRYIAAESYDRSFSRLLVKYLRYLENTTANGVIIRATSFRMSANFHCTMRNWYFNRQRSQNSESHRISIRNDNGNVGLCGVNTRYTLDTKKFTKNSSEGEREKARGTEAE